MMTIKIKIWLGEEERGEAAEAASGCQGWNPRRVEIRRSGETWGSGEALGGDLDLTCLVTG